MTPTGRNTAVLSLTSVALTACLILTAGCSKKEEAAPAPAEQEAAGFVEAGKAVFVTNNCANCHTIAGQGGRTAPELTHVGSQSDRTPEWIVAHVKNPKTHKPMSRMPPFEGKISDKDLVALAAYLASLK